MKHIDSIGSCVLKTLIRGMSIYFKAAIILRHKTTSQLRVKHLYSKSHDSCSKKSSH